MHARQVTLQALNLLGFAVMLGMNYAANAMPINNVSTQELSDMYPSLFTPAGFTFSIWGLIYLSLLGFCVYQSRGLFFRSRGHNMLFVHEIGYLFFVSCIFNAGWIVAWHYMHIHLSVLIMTALLITLIKIYLNLDVGRRRVSLASNLFVYLPFRMYLGWISIATIANVSALLVYIGWDGGGLSPQTWTIIMIMVAALLTVGFLVLRRDLAVGLVSLWALFGITFKRLVIVEPPDLMVALSSVLGMGLVVAFMVWAVAHKIELSHTGR